MPSQDDYLKLAQRMLHEAGYEIRQIDWLAFTHNAVFEVWTSADEHFVLRLGAYSANRLIAKLEQIWLGYLQKQGIKVPVLARVLTFGKSAGLLFDYLDGVSPEPEQVTSSELHSIGIYLAQVHQASQQFGQEVNLYLSQLDWEGLFGEIGYYRLNYENRRVFTVDVIKIMQAVAERVRLAMDEIGQGKSEFGIIHGDFLLKNILIHEANVYALDWEFFGQGYYLYDLTPLLWQLKPQARYEELKTAFLAGYESLRPLTVQHKNLLETFIAGRQVASLRWIAANQQNPHVLGKVEQILAQRSAELVDFLETGQLKRT